jgi:hypothetical protein
MRLSDAGADAKRRQFIQIIDPLPGLLNLLPAIQLLLGAMLATKLENPPLQNYCNNGRHTEYQQKDWELLGQGIPSLRNTDPQVGA